MVPMLVKVEKCLFRILVGLVSLSIFSLLLLVTAQILSRQFQIRFLAPPDEIVTLVFAWMVFLGSALLMRDKSHLRVELIDLYLENKPALKKIYQILLSLLIIAFLIMMTKSGLRIVDITGSKTSPMLKLPQRIWYTSLPVSSVLMIFYSLVHLIQDVIDLFGGLSSNKTLKG